AADDADLSQCHQAQDTLEAFPLGGGNARARCQVIVDDFDLLPAQRTHSFGHGILEKLALLILSYLFFAGLPQVENRLASQVLRFDFGIVQDLCHCRFPPPRESVWTGEIVDGCSGTWLTHCIGIVGLWGRGWGAVVGAVYHVAAA